ncbi:uncharacterized protein WM277_009507 [Molossus nigricans]
MSRFGFTEEEGLSKGKSLYIFHLCGLLSSLPLGTTGSASSPWRLCPQQKACSRHNSQTKEGALELAQVGVFRRSAITCAMRACQKGNLAILLRPVILSCIELWTAHASALEFLGEPDLASGDYGCRRAETSTCFLPGDSGRMDTLGTRSAY